MADHDLRVTAILVNYRSLDDIDTTLASGVLDDHNVIVVDNGDDPDGVASLCNRHGAVALLIEKNIGFAAAVNRAVATVDKPALPWLLLNPDIRLTRSDLSRMLAALADDLDGVAPLLELSNGSLQVGAAGGKLSLASVATYFLFVSHVVPAAHGVFLTRSQSRKVSQVAWLCMACLLLKPDAFSRFGPIPESEVVYAEDLAWGTAATVRGAHFRLLNTIVVRHDQGGSGGSDRWIGAFSRLCRSRLGRPRGTAAVAAMRVGLTVRRLAGRRVT